MSSGDVFNEFTREDVASHNCDKSCWVIIDSNVYDLTKFKAMHPGGEGVILEVAGKDATEAFYGLHRSEVLSKYQQKYLIGRIRGEKPTYGPKKDAVISNVPYAEASYWMGFKSPYFKESHKRFRLAIRKFFEEQIVAEALSSEDMNKPPTKEVYRKMGQFGLLACRMGPGPHLKMFPQLPGGIQHEEFDYFHEQIAHEEMYHMGIPSYADGLGAGLVIGLPPVMIFGSKELAAKVVPECLKGDKRICLAITEPTVGSDVASLSATAVKSACGKYYIVNGVKKWITNGTFADYFATAVRTDGKGMKGVSMMLIERGEGVETKQIKTSYASSAGTAYVIFENAKVPVGNLLGKENKGFQVIMYNFNHERWLIIAQVIRGTRLVIEECMKWANQRYVFGTKLLEQPVIRKKLANMIAQTEAVQNWLENITYQMTTMNYTEQSTRLAGPLALLKLQSTRVAHYVSDEACQIFGGRAVTRTGMGRIVEAWQRTYKYGAILGGSEEIMADLGVRQAMKEFPPDARL